MLLIAPPSQSHLRNFTFCCKCCRRFWPRSRSPDLLRPSKPRSTKHPSYRTSTFSIPFPPPKPLRSPHPDEIFLLLRHRVAPRRLATLRREIVEATGSCLSSDRGPRNTVVKGGALSAGNRAFLHVNPPPICETRIAVPTPRNLCEHCQMLAPREPLFLVRTSAPAGLVPPVEGTP